MNKVLNLFLDKLVDIYFPDKLPEDEDLKNYYSTIRVELMTQDIMRETGLNSLKQLYGKMSNILDMSIHLPGIYDINNEWGKSFVDTRVISSFYLDSISAQIFFTPFFVELYRTMWRHWQEVQS